MKKIITTIQIVVLFCLLGQFKSYALTNINQVDEVDLLEAIEKISKEYEVYFTFDMTLVTDVKVEYEHRSYSSAEEAISTILEGTELRYKFYDQRFVILYREDAEGLESLRKMSQHLDGLIGEGEKSFVKTPEPGVRAVPLLTNHNLSRMIMPVTFSVEGTVTDQDGEPLIGVNIQVKGTNHGTATDFEGWFTLDDIDENAILVVSYIGYQTQEVPVAGKTVLGITLITDSQLLEEVVVVGYGTKQKGQLTGSVSNIKGSSLNYMKTTDITKSLQGAVAGLFLVDEGGEPGRENYDILIRGTHTLGNNAPLIVIDGVPRSGFGQLSSYDIEEVSVLKDASAAIYGARAANGVILVTTKRGKEGKVGVEFNTTYGINALTRLPKFMDSWQYAIYQNEVQERYGGQPPFTDEDIEKYKSGEYPLTHPNTDWYREAFKDYSPESSYNLSASGGSKNLQFYLSGNYLDKNSNYSSNDGNYKQYQMRSNIDANVHKLFSVGLDIALRLEKDRQPPVGINGISHRAWFNWPTEVARYPNGLPGSVHENGNIIVINSFATGFDQRIKKLAQTKLSYEFDMNWIIKGLTSIGYASFDYIIDNNATHQKPVLTYNYNQNTEEYDEILSTYPGGGRTNLRKRNNTSENKLYHIRLAYENNFYGHNISGFIAYEQSESKYEWMEAFRRDLFSDSKLELFAGEEEGRTVNGSSSNGGRVNYFGFLSYDFKRKYLVDLTIRRDGSFNFPKEKRFGLFPSISVGWNIANEDFMSGTKDIINNLKIRMSYGKMGNDRISSYQYLTKFVTGTFAIFGMDPTYNSGMRISNIPNPNITWEEAYVQNYGVDIGLFNNALDLTIDYFYENRKNILIKRNLSVPLYAALTLPDENLGEVNNRGIELAFNYISRGDKIIYNIGGNFTYARNKIIFMDESPNIPEYRKQEGFPVNSIVSYVTDGIFRNEAEIQESPHIPGTVPGDLRYVDMDGNGEITDNDRVRFYRTPTPEIQFAVNLGVNYNNFEVFAMLQGQANAMTVLMFNDGGGKPVEVFEQRWTKDNPIADHPRAYGGFSNFQRQSTYHHNDASYLRLKNLEIGYNFTLGQWFQENLFKNCRVFVRGRNLFTLDHIKIFDPEVPYTADYTRGSRAKYYPQLINYSLGINISF